MWRHLKYTSVTSLDVDLRKFIRRFKSLFVGWKVYSSSTNKAKIYSYSIFVQQMYWLQDTNNVGVVWWKKKQSDTCFECIFALFHCILWFLLTDTNNNWLSLNTLICCAIYLYNYLPKTKYLKILSKTWSCIIKL